MLFSHLKARQEMKDAFSFGWSLAAACVLIPLQSLAATPSSLMVTSISISALSSVPVGDAGQTILSGKNFPITSEGQFVKLSLAFASAVKVGKVFFESCAGDFKDGADFFFYPGWRHGFSEGGRPTFESKVVDSDQPIQTLTVNFRHNVHFCFKSLRISSPDGVPIILKPAESMVFRDAGASFLKNLSLFSKSQIGNALDSELMMRDENEIWIFRFRADGTFFIRGFNDAMNEARAFSAWGKYEIKKSEKKDIVLSLKGERAPTPAPWDGVIVDDASGKNSPLQKPVDEEVMVEMWAGESFMIRNRTKRSHRSLQFSDVNVKKTSLTE